MDNEFERLAYDASLRSLDKQEQLLSEVRARTAVLLAVSSVAASVLGMPSLDDPLAIGVFAILAFVLSVAASMYVLVPKSNLVFSVAGSALYERFFDYRAELPDVYRRLAYDLDGFWESNNRAIVRLLRAFWVAAAALVAEIVLLLASISGTLT